MSEASRGWAQLTLWGLASGISSPASADGPLPSDSPGSATTRTSGRGRARASRSATPAASAEPTTIATSGPPGSASSASATLQSSLESRLRVELASGGSTLYSLTWRERDTPAQRRICQLQASALRTSDSGCSSWPTPTVSRGDYSRRNGNPDEVTLKLAGTAKLAAWPTASARDWKSSASNKHGENSRPLNEVARLAAWPTPTVADSDRASDTYHHGENNPTLLGAARRAAWPTPDKMSGDRRGPADPNAKTRPSGHKVQFTINHAAATTAPWPTPRAADGSNGSTTDNRSANGQDLPTVAGRTATGSPAPTASRGQLNPEHTRWLMGYAAAWGSCADTATRSSPKSRRRSSGER